MNEKKGLNKAAAVLLGLVGAFVLVVGLLLTGFGIMDIVDSAQDTEEASQWFDSYADSSEKQLLYFQWITESFANYEFNDRRELYFVMDEYSQLYVVCMDRDDMKKYQDVYEYTYYGSENEAAPSGRIEGYAAAIDEELEAMIIECFNEMIGEEFLTEDNFYDYVGDHYLDAAYDQGIDRDTRDMLMIGIIFVAAGLAIVIAVICVRRRAVRAERSRSSMAERAAMVQAYQERQEQTFNWNGASCQKAGIYEEQAGHPLRGILGAVLGAALGGLIWIALWKIGFIAGISGYAAVFGADLGYQKLSGREPDGPSFAMCVILGIGMIIFANYISYAWELVDAVNESSPGSAAFGSVFRNLPRLMKSYEIWGDFVADLIMGLLFSVFAVVGELSARRRRRQ